MAVIESAAAGTPYLVSDIAPHVEVTKGEKGGLIFEKNNPKDLAGKILKLLKNEELYGKKEGECQELASQYEWRKIAGRLERVYEKLM